MSSSYKIKIILCGSSDEIIEKFIRSFFKSRIDVDFKTTSMVTGLHTRDVELPNSQIATLSIWIIGGNKRFSEVRSTLYKGAAGAILVFDLSNGQSWDDVKNWRAEIKQFAGDIPFVLIGNNLDIKKLGR